MNILKAIDIATQVEQTPEALLDGRLAKEAILSLHSALRRSTCYYNATRKGKETFVLVDSDDLAADAIQNWLDRAVAAGVPQDKLGDVPALIARFRAKALRHAD